MYIQNNQTTVVCFALLLFCDINFVCSLCHQFVVTLYNLEWRLTKIEGSLCMYIIFHLEFLIITCFAYLFFQLALTLVYYFFFICLTINHIRGM
jgi:hypothetical protein